ITNVSGNILIDGERAGTNQQIIGGYANTNQSRGIQIAGSSPASTIIRNNDRIEALGTASNGSYGINFATNGDVTIENNNNILTGTTASSTVAILHGGNGVLTVQNNGI